MKLPDLYKTGDTASESRGETDIYRSLLLLVTALLPLITAPSVHI